MSGRGRFHIWSAVSAVAVRERDSRTVLHVWSWVAVAVRELEGGVVDDEVEVYWEVEREVSIVGLESPGR